MTRRIKVLIKDENEKKKKRSYFFSYLTTKIRNELRVMGNVTR